MAPPVEYDKEPKAPDKSAAADPNDDSKHLYNNVNDQQTNSDHKPGNTAANTEVEVSDSISFFDLAILRSFLTNCPSLFIRFFPRVARLLGVTRPTLL